MRLEKFPFQLTPQTFGDTAATSTVLKARDFRSEFKEILPSIYQKAPNFIKVVELIADSYQELYDIIRSLANVPNVTGVQSGGVAASRDVYLLMFTRLIDVSIRYETNIDGSLNIEEGALYDDIAQKVIAMNSRGTHRYFENYYLSKGLYTYFTNTYVEETKERTVKLQTPFFSDAIKKSLFEADISRIKGGGIRVNETQASSTNKFFWFSSNPAASTGTVIDFESDPTTNRGNFGSLLKGLPQGSGRFSDELKIS